MGVVNGLTNIDVKHRYEFFQVEATDITSLSPLAVVVAEMEYRDGSAVLSAIKAFISGGVILDPASLILQYHDPFRGVWEMILIAARSKEENTEAIQLLLDHGAPVDPPVDFRGPSALVMACYRGAAGIVAMLLRRGASPNPINRHCTPPLAAAAGKDNTKVVLMLLAAGAVVDPEVEDVSLMPLVRAAGNGRLDLVRLFVDFDARPQIRLPGVNELDEQYFRR